MVAAFASGPVLFLGSQPVNSRAVEEHDKLSEAIDAIEASDARDAATASRL
jgi:hypothetical protein